MDILSILLSILNLILFSSLGLLFILTSTHLFRNSLIYRIRDKCYNDNDGTFNQLPAYDEMHADYSCWTKNSFVKKYCVTKKDQIKSKYEKAFSK